MTAHTSTRKLARAMRACATICSAMVVIGTGCQQTRVAPAGGGAATDGWGGRATSAPAPIMAEYAMGTLSTTLGPELPVPTLRAAAEQTLRARGYVITDSVGTTDHMRVSAASRAAGSSDRSLEHTTISARVTWSRTRLEIESGTFGDEAASRAILDDLLRRVGR